MPQQVSLYRALIASPGDCVGEREVIPRVIRDWNAAHAFESRVLIEPVLWESHTRPQLGDRAQSIINRQIVDACDFVIGTFWTRLGTPTGVAPSGTAEELERFRSSGRQVLLYFSTAPVSPDRIDLTQIAALQAYRSQIESNGLTFRYAGLHELEMLLSRHLAMVMAEFIGASGQLPSSAVLADKLAIPKASGSASERMTEVFADLKCHTRYFWPYLVALPAHKDSFDAEMKEETFKTIKRSLDYLVSEGHLTYTTDPAYVTVTDGTPVFYLRASDVTTQLRNLARAYDREHEAEQIAAPNSGG